MEGNQPVVSQPSSEAGIKKPLYKKGWFIAALAVSGVLILGLAVAFWLGSFSKGSGGSGSAKDVFYSMIEATAQQTKVRYAYESVQPKSEGQSGRHIVSLAEYDYTNKKYNTVFISEAIIAKAERCVDGKPYRNPDIRFPKDFAQATEAINGTSAINTSPVPAKTCDFRETRNEGHFSDAIIPVGLSATQAKAMADDLRGNDAIELKDEGQVTYNGKPGRKIAFDLNPEKNGRPYKPDMFFFSFRDGTSEQVGGNGIKLDAIDDHRAGDLIGYGAINGIYVIDEKTKLPLYSEITLAGSSEAAYEPATTWSKYEYPDTFTINPNTPLPEIKKLQ